MATRKTSRKAVASRKYSKDTSTFEDQAVYRCDRCEWSTPYEERMQAHVAAHGPETLSETENQEVSDGES